MQIILAITPNSCCNCMFYNKIFSMKMSRTTFLCDRVCKFMIYGCSKQRNMAAACTVSVWCNHSKAYRITFISEIQNDHGKSSGFIKQTNSDRKKNGFI